MSVIQEAIRKIKIRKLGIIDWNVFPFKKPLDSKIPSRRLLNLKEFYFPKIVQYSNLNYTNQSEETLR
jgi:hypothetical protein